MSIDIKYNLDKNENRNVNQQPFDLATFDAIFSSATEVRILIINNASENIKKIHIKAAVMQTEKPLINELLTSFRTILKISF